MFKRKLKGLLLSLATVSLLALSFTPVSASEDVLITSFDISVDVNENGLMSIDQNIDVLFNASRHGIYAYIPQRYDMTWTIDGSTVDKTYYFPVRKLNVKNDPYESSIDSYDNVVLQIGDADVYVSGEKQYQYSYIIQMRDLDLDGRQALYFNLVGDGWDLSMNSVSFSITLPKAWPEDIRFYSGYYGNDAPADVSYSIDGNTLTGNLNTSLSSNQALTIYAPLPNDFFTFIPAPDYTLPSLGIFILLTLLTAFVFFKYGKDDKVTEVVEFYPIKGLSSAMTGFIYEGIVDTRDVVSLIIEWAFKGYLTIGEEDTRKKDFVLTKIKDIDETEIKAEKTLFVALFNGTDVVTSEDLKNTFYRSVEFAKSDIYRYFQGNKERRIFDTKATVLKVIFGIISLLPVGLVTGSIVYKSSYIVGEGFGVGVITVILSSVVLIAWSIAIKFWPSFRKVKRFFTTVGLIALSFVYAIILLAILSIYGLEFWKILLTFVLIAANIGFVSVMDRRTELGSKYLGHILGLKNFIEAAEKDKLEALIHDDPSYFYRILPYAYVLNISDTWSKKFETIVVEQPDWYVGPSPLNTYIFMSYLNRNLSSMSRAMTSVPAKSGRGGGSFGGGGGGFSGGGFGGGGGGSW